MQEQQNRSNLETLMPPTLIAPADMQLLVNCASIRPPGAFLEVGVYHGGSAWWLQKIARDQKRALYLYDTFEGIPYTGEHDTHKVGDFKDVDEAKVRAALPYATITKGVFPASAVPMGPIAFAHLDCDQYQSVKDACAYLVGSMVSGGVIWFDDSPILPGAHKAVLELFEGHIALSRPRGKHYVVF
jgi:asparagine synthase (glutamine-hydrolysing)